MRNATGLRDGARGRATLRGAVLAGCLLALLVPASQAQYVGPSSYAADNKAKSTPKSVAEILKNPVDDQPVVLRGVLVKKVGKEKYIFSDGTGEIRVEIDTKDFPVRRLDEKTQIELRGDVEKEFLQSPEIDASLVTVITW